MQGLKFLVIFLGVLIVIGLGILVYGIATKAGKLADAPATVDGAAIDLPDGATVLEMTTGEGRLYVRVGNPSGGQSILIFDDRGRDLGKIELR